MVECPLLLVNRGHYWQNKFLLVDGGPTDKIRSYFVIGSLLADESLITMGGGTLTCVEK